MDIVPHLFDATMYGNKVPAVSRHLWHERQSVQTAPLIERRENLGILRTSTISPGRSGALGLRSARIASSVGASNSLARANWEIWYSALFTEIANDNDDAADRHERHDYGKIADSGLL